MKKIILTLAFLILIFGFVTVKPAEARGRYGSIRIGGYSSHGLGSHYIGGYVRSGPALNYRSYYPSYRFKY